MQRLLRKRSEARFTAGDLPACGGRGAVVTGQGFFRIQQTCPGCGGRGSVITDPCLKCHGAGRVEVDHDVAITVPAGVDNGMTIRHDGYGDLGRRGGPSGDLYVVVHVGTHPVFGRKGDNLTITVPVSFPEAALGGDIKVPTLGGPPVTLKLPPGTPNGRTLRARGKGAVRKDGSRGDLLVTVEVAVPPVLEGEALGALKSYREATAGTDPREELFKAAKGA